MKTTAIFTRTLTTSTVPAFDLVRQGWQIQSIDIDGVITATKQQLVNCDKDAAMSNMKRHNLCDSNKEYGTEIVSKIDFGVYKICLVWNAEDRCVEAWMHHPVITDISSVIPKEDEEYISQEDIDYDNACFDADMRDFEDRAAAWDARTSKETQDWLINNRHLFYR